MSAAAICLCTSLIAFPGRGGTDWRYRHPSSARAEIGRPDFLGNALRLTVERKPTKSLNRSHGANGARFRFFPPPYLIALAIGNPEWQRRFQRSSPASAAIGQKDRQHE
jgi:hypothetical protein